MSLFRSVRLLMAAGVAILLTSYVACSQKSTPSDVHLESRDEDPGHGLHTVNSDRLREIMHGLTAIEMERLHADASGGGPSQDRIERVAQSAAQLAEDARILPFTYKDLTMNAESRRVFDDLALRLRRHCLELEQLARTRQTRALKPKMDEITRTCNDCHASFRGPQMAMRGKGIEP